MHCQLLNLLLLFICILSSCREKEEIPKISTKAENVHLVERAFQIKDLNRERLVRVYVPIDYDENENRYPVLYMHDGQNIFDELTSYAGEWGVDETLNELRKEIIVVGIDNGQVKRMNEMGPWDHKDYGRGEGDQYLSFIVDQVKPYIDSIYRTKPSRENTAIMGSSMGALISHYGIYQYPEVFSKAGIFSPSYWYSDRIFEITGEAGVAGDARLYIIVGAKEGRQMVLPAKRMAQQIIDSGHPSENIYFENVRGGDHSEEFWRDEFKDCVTWLFESE